MLLIEYTLKYRGQYITKSRYFADQKHFERFIDLIESQGKKCIRSKEIK